MPDKAIDLVDEACAMIRTEMDSMPAELDDLRRKIMQHEIEEAALKKGDRPLSAQRLSAIQKELAEMREQYNAMKARWDNEKEQHRQPAVHPGADRADGRRHRKRPSGNTTSIRPPS